MSSIERAPEPTMEEILASIRRIISEDESSATERPTPQSQPVVEALEEAEGEVDNQIVADIARALGAGAQTPVSVVVEEEDILELTGELGGLELVEVEEETLELEIVEDEVPLSLEAEAPLSFAPEAPGAESTPEPETELEILDLDIASEPEAPAETLEAFVPAPPEPVVPETPQPAPRSASEEAASALERAIAALRAGQVPTSLSELTPQPPSAPEPALQAQPEPILEPEPVPELEPIPEPESIPEPEPVLEAEAEPEFVLSELEVIEEELIVAEAPAEPAPFWVAEPSQPEPAPEPEPEPEPEFEPEPEPVQAVYTNGASGHEGHEDAPKTLEDSVKDMLRPMLRQWLDENMSRVVAAVLKDEISSNPARFERD